ncbi:uncharacterized protein BP01DRAFT_128229 [Aspergillus saccharolyticus JOP 1030-1]|uniref:Uncharacterized protein n=1 Tax=Aspergillus saccharolyticus JOP 1030-1 TaxID=1450539 RepID=A0A318Z8N4_9EURO|nr:hypothetical protein BP01DRAFT_128229 [Aspergillus saccharolyticus JOP 1030-1]PYH42727.1 hypothetical protein BP01DRAFT_128229 [Aspergillus saccharolyticus JOP 1030-1]
MDLHSDRSFNHMNAFAPSSSSSSFPRSRRGSQQQSNPLHATHTSSSGLFDTVRPSQPTLSYRNDELFLIPESSRAHRATALRQLNGATARPLSGRSRPAASRPSSLGSQPVLVRAYSGGPDEASTQVTMPSRRSFLWSSSSTNRDQGPALPSEEDFSIDSILRAIEPDIRHTLDAIGKICGRSKLSLANEYGSHIAPLGEIRAPPGGLLTVEEASPDHERQADHLVIYDDDNSVANGRDHHSGPSFRYWDHVRQVTTGYHSRMSLSGDGSSAQIQPSTPRSSVAFQSSHGGNGFSPLSTTREIASKSNASGRALLGKNLKNDARGRTCEMITPALVSETLLEAQAESRCSQPSAAVSEVHRRKRPLSPGNSNPCTEQNPGDRLLETTRPSSMVDIRSLFGWLRYMMTDGKFKRSPTTAEMMLRAMLERQGNGRDE